jgi:hypothetical protein
VKLKLPEAFDVLKICTLSQLKILEGACKDGSVSIILFFQLQYWIDHGEINIIPSFKAFNHHMCLTNSTKLLAVVMSLLKIYKAPSRKVSIIDSLHNTIYNLFKKEEPVVKSDAYYDTNLKCWVIRGVPCEEMYDMGEVELKTELEKMPTPMVISCEQQSRSFRQSRYLAQPFL